jgi:DNA helicase-2/ATP-dependent DNA helicase PcrA
VLTASKGSGPKPTLTACPDGAQQAWFVAQKIKEHQESGVPWEEIAVLYRSHFHALELQLELTRQQIPFSITSGIRFFEQAHVKDVVAYLKLTANPRDEVSFKRLALMLPGIGARAAEKIWNLFQSEIAAGRVEKSSSKWLGAALKSCAAQVPRKSQKDWAQFTETMIQLGDEMARSTSNMIRLIVDAGYDDYLKDNFANASARLEDIGQIAGFAQQFDSLEEFLTQLALLTDIETGEGSPDRAEESRVRLSTVHQAKGLEFNVVFVIMLCEGMFPSHRSIETDENAEEERRLFYVALTRAREHLHLSYPLLHGSYQRGISGQEPSRFLDEIPSRLIQRTDLMAAW